MKNEIMCEGRNYLPIDNTCDGRPCKKEAIRFFIRTNSIRKTYHAFCDEHPNSSTFGIRQDTELTKTESISREVYLIESIHES